jgi:hypothetical protein
MRILMQSPSSCVTLRLAIDLRPVLASRHSERHPYRRPSSGDKQKVYCVPHSRWLRKVLVSDTHRRGRLSATAQRSNDSGECPLQAGFVSQLTLPDHDGVPAHTAQTFANTPVTGGIAFELLPPERDIGGGHAPSAAVMPVPEAAMNEHSNFPGGKDDIGSPR